MRKGDQQAFADFMRAEAERVGRVVTEAEILTWFETFPKLTIDEFKGAWQRHQDDAKRGGAFPTPARILAMLKPQKQPHDWRCSEQVNGERCGFPGGMNGGYGPQCAAHFTLRGSTGYSEAASLQIITASRDYVPPASPMEVMERGERLRQESARRWREAHGLETAAAEATPEPTARAADAHVAAADAARLDDINRALREAEEGMQ